MPSRNVAKHPDVWTIICSYLRYRQPADLRSLSVTCSSITRVAREVIFQSLIIGPTSSFLVAFSSAEGPDRRIPVPLLSFIHTLHLNTLSPGEPDENEQMIQSRVALCLHHLPRLSVFSLECRHIILPLLEALSQLAGIRPIDFTLRGGAAFAQPPMPHNARALKYVGLSFMKNIMAWSSHDVDRQLAEHLLSRSADTLTSLRVDDSHIGCLSGLANQFLKLPHLRNLVVFPTYTELNGRFALPTGLAQAKALRAEPDSPIDAILSQCPSIDELYLASTSVTPRSLPSTAIPNLRKVTSDASTLALLVPGRPVTTAVLTAPWPVTRGNERLAALDEDDRAAIAWQDRCRLETLATEEQAAVFRCAYALSHSTGPVRRLVLPLVRPANWHTKLAKQALAAFVEALPTVEYLTVQLDPMDVPFGFASLASLPRLRHIYLIANGAFVQGNDLLETILVLQSSCPHLRRVDFDCGGLRMFNAQKELTCKLEWKWCMRGKDGGDAETRGRWHEHGYADEEETSGPMDVPPVEKAKLTLKQRISKLSEKWKRRGTETKTTGENELGDTTDSDKEREVPPPYTA